jgi:hypothetical protein
MLQKQRKTSIGRVITANLRDRLGRKLNVAVLAVALAPNASLAVTASISLETVGSMSANNQAAWWSPIAQHDGKVYVSYLAPNSPQDDVFVAERTGPNAWTKKDTGLNSRYDVGHTQTSLAVDGEGYLHLFYGMHNDPITYARSTQPGNIAAGFISSSPSAFSGGRYPYPNLTTTPAGDVYMIIRDRRSTYVNTGRDGRLFRFSNSRQSWSELPPFAGQTGTTVYPDQVFADPSGQLHIIWEWASGGPQGSRHYGSYARFDPATNKYYKADGSIYSTTPISINAADVYQGLEGTETFSEGVFGVQAAKMAIDDQGRPVIVYGYSTNGTDSSLEHRVARWTGTEWTRTTVTPGPFDIDKAWITYSDGMLRFYGTLSPNDPMHTGTDDIFLKASTDYGLTWTKPVPVTSGLNIQRPVGITVGNTDYLYLPSTSEAKLYVAVVTVPEPAAKTGMLIGSGCLVIAGAFTCSSKRICKILTMIQSVALPQSGGRE